MITISIITVFPHLHDTFINQSIIGRAQEKGLIHFNLVSFSDFCAPKERIDEPAAGPGAGMVIKPTVVEKAIEDCIAKWGNGFIIFFTPQGEQLTQRTLEEIAFQILPQESYKDTDNQQINIKSAHIILVCARYEGIDQRVEEHYANKRISVGNFVVMGGDIPAQLFLEGFLRLIPHVVGKKESVANDSFQGPFLDYPTYGLPNEWKEKRIPEVIQSGNHAVIEQWREDKAAEQTIKNNFSWFTSSSPSEHQVTIARKHIPPHYAAIMHTDVLLKNGTVGQTSIPSLDIHDIARSCTTYGIKNFFIVSPLNDQQNIVETFIKFWRSDGGRRYNESRYEALKCIEAVYTFDEMVKSIEKKEGIKPLIIGTSAQTTTAIPTIDYKKQSQLWQNNQPILLVFGTGQGLSQEIINKFSYMLTPITGLTAYNHLSVRSAVAIVLDRWLGLHPNK